MKLRITEFSAWRYLGADIKRRIQKEPGTGRISSSELAALIIATVEPGTLQDSGAECLRALFLKFHSEHTDLSLALARLIRAKWNSQSHSAVAQRFFAMNQFLPDGRGRGGRTFTSHAKDAEARWHIEKSGGPRIDLEIIKKARQQLFRRDPGGLYIRRELQDEWRRLRKKGYPV